MRNYLKNSFINLMQTIAAGFAELNKMSVEDGCELLADMQKGVIRIGTLIEEEGTAAEQSVIPVLEEFCEQLYLISRELENGGITQDAIKKIRRQNRTVTDNLREKLTARYEIVFLPYKASMWDSMESVYKAARADPDCNAVVMPIPYYNLGAGRTALSCIYEIDQYPPDVEVTDYRNYSIRQTHPDAVFIHNPYDEYNYITQVPEEYFSSELVKYTDHLVYIPYKVCMGKVKDIYCTMPGVSNSWRTFVQSERVREVYLKYYPPEKIVAAGSPKFDKVILYNKNKPDLPCAWETGLSGKKVFLLNTHLKNIMNYPDRMFKKLRYIFSLFYGRKDAALLWRPHPLSMETIKSMKPGILPEYLKLVEEFKKMENGIYDVTSDVHRAIAASDAYIGDWSSLVAMYGVTGKPVMVLSICAGQESLLERYGDSLRASAFCADRDTVCLAYIGNNDLYEYRLKTKDTTYIGCFDAELYGRIGMIRYMFCYDGKLFLSGGTDEEIHVICRPKTRTMKTIARRTAAYPADQITNCIQWSDRIYIITGNIAGIGYVDMKSERFIGEAAFSCMKLSKPLTVCDSVLSDDRIILLCNEANVILIFQLKTKSVEMIEDGLGYEKMVKLCVEDNEIYLLSEEMKLYRYEINEKNLFLFTDIGEVFKTDKRVGKILKYRQSLFIIPEGPNSIYELNIKTKMVKKLRYPENIQFDSDDVYPNFSRFSGYEMIGNRLLLCPRVSNQLLTLNMENGEIAGEKIPLPYNWSMDEAAEDKLTMSYRIKRPNSIYYEEYYGLKRYIDIVLTGKDRKAEQRQKEYSDNFCNLSGESGKEIWNHVKSAL